MFLSTTGSSAKLKKIQESGELYSSARFHHLGFILRSLDPCFPGDGWGISLAQVSGSLGSEKGVYVARR
jgi:hypothetical protein